MKLQKWFIILVPLLICGVHGNMTAAAAVSGGAVEDDQVFADTYFLIPGTGEWAHFEIGVPDSLLEYTFKPKCFSDGNGYIDCLNENERFCPAAQGGKLVYWFSRLKNSGLPWSPMGPNPSCVYSERPEDTGDRIAESILSEFQSRQIVPGRLTMQPSPHTLIGAHTNFYVEAEEQTFDFLMLEQDIRIVARPTEYEWHYGDGRTYGPAPYAGSPIPPGQWGEETTTSHVYQETGDYQASVTIYFSAEYSINGGPFVPIDGRATVPSTPQTISVWKAESRSVADDCIANPAGVGC